MASGKTTMFTKMAKATANNATEPTDKSIPPVKITINIPILTIPIPDTCFNKLERLVSVKIRLKLMLKNYQRTKNKDGVVFKYELNIPSRPFLVYL
jgi:hypothetical protein